MDYSTVQLFVRSVSERRQLGCVSDVALGHRVQFLILLGCRADN